MSATSIFPELFHARPEWPNRDDEHLFWVGLNSRFSFAHHPVKGDDQTAGAEDVLSFFCRPGRVADQLQSYLQHSRSGGSVLVTGYRGTGKTSLVNYCLDELKVPTQAKLETVAKGALEKMMGAISELDPIGPALAKALKDSKTTALKDGETRAQKMLVEVEKVLTTLGQALEKTAAEPAKAKLPATMQVELKAEVRDKVRSVQARLQAVWKTLEAALKGRALIKIRVNMATVTCASDVLVLVFDGLIECVKGMQGIYLDPEEADERTKSVAVDRKGQEQEPGRITCCGEMHKQLRAIRNALESRLKDLRSKSSVEHQTSPRLDQFATAGGSPRNPPGTSSEQSFEREALSRHQAGLVEQIRHLREVVDPEKIVFIFDEVDKLMPVDDWADDKPEDESREIRKLGSLQHIVADLKYFLSESPSHQIFIAGKDVDDSWAEDQNRGEGIFESIFASNINVASIFTLELEPCQDPLPKAICWKPGEAESFYTLLAGQLGIPKNSLVYRTALLILPHLAEYEIVQLLTRAYLRKPALGRDEAKKLEKWLKSYYRHGQWDQPGLKRDKADMTKARKARKEHAAHEERLQEAKAALKAARSEHAGQEEAYHKLRSILDRLAADVKAAKSGLERAGAAAETRAEELVEAQADFISAAVAFEGARDLLEKMDADFTRTQEALEEAKAALKAANDAQAELAAQEAAELAALAKPPKRRITEDHTPWFKLRPMSERTCRRLRILIEYLTYKGRGIPRKVLREFYGMVRPSICVPNDDPGFRKLWRDEMKGQTDRYGNPSDEVKKTGRVVTHVLAFPQHLLQKMNFYASIVEHLDRNFALLRGLNDKGRVSIFHIIDYLLKFYGTGFSHRDLEHAPFMTAREELFPSRQLAALILRIMDGKLWKRKDTRSPEYRMLHHVAHDLAVMFLRYGPEQMELRHTMKDFRDEVPRLKKSLEGSRGVSAEARLAPIHAELRLARIHELCGRHYEARLGYYCAVRWLRLDICHFENQGSTADKTRVEAMKEHLDLAKQMGAALAEQMSKTAPAKKGSEKIKVSELMASQNLPSLMPMHTSGFSVAFVSYLVESHLALGRLLEEVGELRAAVHHYEEACTLCDGYFKHSEVTADATNKGTPKERVRLGAGEDIPRYADYGERLWQTLFEEEYIDLPTAQAASPRLRFNKERLARVLARRPPMRPLKLAGIPQGYVQVCNQAAIAYSKLWERSSANAYFMRALVHLDEIGDEYGLVEQLFFIGQVMVRRRDMVAAAFWYRAALLKSRAIRMHSTHIVREDGKSHEFREAQNGAGWQTPPVINTLEAQIAASLGDVIFATGGHAFHVYAEVKTKENAKAKLKRSSKGRTAGASVSPWEFRSPETDQEAQTAIWTFIRAEMGHESILRVDDRWEEFFFTQARRSYEAGEQDIDARDVYLRQLESRLYRFEHAIGSLDKPEEEQSDPPDERSDKTPDTTQYTLLNAWTTFWRGARVLLHRNLIAVTSLARDRRHTWGRISDLRRMGTTLRLIGTILVEVALRPNEAMSRRLLVQASKTLESIGRPVKIDGKSAAPVQFYSRFLGGVGREMKPVEILKNLAAARRQFRKSSGCDVQEVNQCMQRELVTTRVDVNAAASDILTIFAYLGDRADLLGAHLADERSVEDVGVRSPLFRVNGGTENALPIASAYKSLRPAGDPGPRDVADDLGCHFKLLVLAEKAMLSSYLCYRDCIPDFSYAQSCVKVGELYAAALYKLGTWIANSKNVTVLEGQIDDIASAILGFTEHGKRFLTKAIDILNREQEQNRNTFHMMSEAWFNLADILTLRLLAVTGATETLGTELFGPKEMSRKIASRIQTLGRAGNAPVSSQNSRHAMRDLVPEDLRRQIEEAYQSGLRYVQSEMNDFNSRYRVPGDVFYAHRNLMDPVLHFRICRSIRLRHSGGRHDRGPDTGSKAVRDRFEEITHEICDRISGYESPQLSYDDESGITPSHAWASKLSELIKFANKVRTDRGPLMVEHTANKHSMQVTLKWFSVTKNAERGDAKSSGNQPVPRQFVFFPSEREPKKAAERP